MFEGDLAPTRHEPDASRTERVPGAKPRGISLFAFVFDELSHQLGKEFSTAELMQAAQRLIEISKQEYIEKNPENQTRRSTFYSMDLTSAFASHPWQIAFSDTQRLSHCDHEEYSPETMENAKILLQGAGELSWEF